MLTWFKADGAVKLVGLDTLATGGMSVSSFAAPDEEPEIAQSSSLTPNSLDATLTQTGPLLNTEPW